MHRGKIDSSNKILLTGSTGFIGKNILSSLSNRYRILSPLRCDLDISNINSINNFLNKYEPDYLIHTAIATDKDLATKNIYIDTTLAFNEFIKYPFKKIIYIGSGAEYGKDSNIVNASELDIDMNKQLDDYGKAKRELTSIARQSNNIYNLRIFGCYGENEQSRRFINHAISCCLNNDPITIRKDCLFSYIYIQDLVKIVEIFLNDIPKYHDYNISDGIVYKLSDLAMIVKKILNSNSNIIFKENGLSNQYTCSNLRFVNEFKDFKFTSIYNGIKNEIEFIKKIENKKNS